MLNIGLLILRIVVGLTVAGHGAQKLFGWFGGPGISRFARHLNQLGVRPGLPWAVVAGLAEFLGGLLVAAGLLTPLGALAVCGSMLVAIFTVHATKGFWNSNGGYEYPLTILASMVTLALAGFGLYSLDHVLRIALREPLTLVIGAAVVLLGVLAALLSLLFKPAPVQQPQAS